MPSLGGRCHEVTDEGKKYSRRAGSLVQRELDFAEGKRLRDCNPVQLKNGWIILKKRREQVP